MAATKARFQVGHFIELAVGQPTLLATCKVPIADIRRCVGAFGNAAKDLPVTDTYLRAVRKRS
jgi:hypothetical protein